MKTPTYLSKDPPKVHIYRNGKWSRVKTLPAKLKKGDIVFILAPQI